MLFPTKTWRRSIIGVVYLLTTAALTEAVTTSRHGGHRIKLLKKGKRGRGRGVAREKSSRRTTQVTGDDTGTTASNTTGSSRSLFEQLQMILGQAAGEEAICEQIKTEYDKEIAQLQDQVYQAETIVQESKKAVAAAETAVISVQEAEKEACATHWAAFEQESEANQTRLEEEKTLELAECERIQQESDKIKMEKQEVIDIAQDVLDRRKVALEIYHEVNGVSGNNVTARLRKAMNDTRETVHEQANEFRKLLNSTKPALSKMAEMIESLKDTLSVDLMDQLRAGLNRIREEQFYIRANWTDLEDQAIYTALSMSSNEGPMGEAVEETENLLVDMYTVMDKVQSKALAVPPLWYDVERYKTVKAHMFTDTEPASAGDASAGLTGETTPVTVIPPPGSVVGPTTLPPGSGGAETTAPAGTGGEAATTGAAPGGGGGAATTAASPVATTAAAAP
ncbi:unnamed protein product [Amoebophrya sp. A25]|nr:unnamed protein product [Amoebophrya sp. A25]|eukprot:GSA25T00003638001.1